MSDCALTQDYSAAECLDLFGGVATTYIIEKANVSNIALTSDVVTTLTKVTAKFFRKYQLEAHTTEGTETYARNRENGTRKVTQSIKFPINGMSSSVRAEIEKLGLNRLIIILEDENGVGWMYGKNYGLIMTNATSATGKKLDDKNGYDLTFESEEKHFAYKVDASVMSALQTPGT